MKKILNNMFIKYRRYQIKKYLDYLLKKGFMNGYKIYFSGSFYLTIHMKETTKHCYIFTCEDKKEQQQTIIQTILLPKYKVFNMEWIQ